MQERGDPHAEAQPPSLFRSQATSPSADGRAFGQFFGFDAEQGSSFQGKPSPCELAEPAVLEACIEAFDPSCRWAELITSCNNAEPLCEQCP